MKRRRLIKYGLLGSTSLFFNLSQTQKKLIAQMGEKQHYDWVFLYWMPYDNNLSPFGKPILNMIGEGVRNNNLLVAVQMDLWNATQLSRIVMTESQTTTQEISTNQSASVQVFADYLDWAKESFEAKNWAIIFLGHGGHLDEVSPDVHLGEDGTETQWMNIQEIKNEIARFNQHIGKPIEFFFFQNCNKGTLEVHHTFREVANYTLASQVLLGAPNYYYKSLFQFLGHSPNLNGIQLARKIQEFEREDMYSSYTVTDNSRFLNLATVLNRLIDAILFANWQAVDVSIIPSYSYMDEQYVDLGQFFQVLTEQSGAEVDKFNDFVNFMRDLSIYLPNPDIEFDVLSPLGLGLLLPSTPAQLEKYNYLDIYSEVKLNQLFEAILFDS